MLLCVCMFVHVWVCVCMYVSIRTYVCFTNSSMYIIIISPCSGDVAQALSTKAFAMKNMTKMTQTVRTTAQMYDFQTVTV